MRKPRTLLIVALLSLAAACGGGGGEAASESGEPAASEPTAAGAASAATGEELSQDPIRISAGIDGSYAHFFLADELGLFSDAGLNVEIVQFAQGGEGVDALLAGEIQLSGSAESTIFAKSTAGPIAALAIYEESGRYVKLVTSPDIASPADIRRFGIVPGSVSEYGASLVVDQEAIPAEEVEYIPAGPPELPALLQQGDIDAFVLWEPWPTQAAEASATVIGGTEDYGYAYQQWLNASPEWLEGHEAEAQAVLDVLAQAIETMSEDPQAAIDATTAATGIDGATVQLALDEIDFGVRDFTDADFETYAGVIDFLVERDIVDTEPVATDVVRQGFYEGG